MKNLKNSLITLTLAVSMFFGTATQPKTANADVGEVILGVIGLGTFPIWGPIVAGVYFRDKRLVKIENQSDQVVYVRAYFKNQSPPQELLSQDEMMLKQAQNSAQLNDPNHKSVVELSSFKGRSAKYKKVLEAGPTSGILKMEPKSKELYLRSKRVKGWDRVLLVSLDPNELPDRMNLDTYNVRLKANFSCMNGSCYTVYKSTNSNHLVVK